jgi:hypothetical protein
MNVHENDSSAEPFHIADHTSLTRRRGPSREWVYGEAIGAQRLGVCADGLLRLVTTPRASAPVRMSRDQLIASLVVGAVVVLLAFASGIGVEPAGSTPTVSAATPGGAPSGATATVTATPAPVISYIAVPGAPVGPALPVVPVHVTVNATAAASSTAAPSPSPSSPSMTPHVVPGGTPAPSCPADVLSGLLGALGLNSVTSSSSGLLGILGILDPVAPASHSVDATMLTDSGLLSTVTSLLGNLPLLGGFVGSTAPGSVSPQACTTALSPYVTAARGSA